jgi:hypothetical protein
MNIQTILHILILLTFSLTQPMELNNSTHDTKLYPKILCINKPLINELITINRDNKLHHIPINIRTERLDLLRELIHQGAQVTFRSDTHELQLWKSRQEPTIYKNSFYDELFSFFSATKDTPHYNFFETQKQYIHSLQHKKSRLRIVIAKTLLDDTAYALNNVLRKYGYNFFAIELENNRGWAKLLHQTISDHI